MRALFHNHRGGKKQSPELDGSQSRPKRLRFFTHRNGAVLGIYLRVMAQTLQDKRPGVANTDKAALHIGAVAFILSFGSSQNEPVHFHVRAVDRVFVAVACAAAHHPNTPFHIKRECG